MAKQIPKYFLQRNLSEDFEHEHCKIITVAGLVLLQRLDELWRNIIVNAYSMYLK